MATSVGGGWAMPPVVEEMIRACASLAGYGSDTLELR
jgi:hypothetical protein